MEKNAAEWVPINKGWTPTQFISPDGKKMLLTSEEWSNGSLKSRKSEITDIDKPPHDIEKLLKKVRFTFSNYEQGSVGKELSDEADTILRRLNP
jgi:hypothetical protein